MSNMPELPAVPGARKVWPPIMSRDLALKLGVLDVPFNDDGTPMVLDPPRPTMIVIGVVGPGKGKWMYWPIVPDDDQSQRREAA